MRRRPHESYADVIGRVTALEAAHPARVAVRVIGASAGGEPIRAVEIGPRGGGCVMVIATLHAMEHVGAQAALALAERAAAGAAGWNARRLVVVPIANPDGFLAVERSLAAGKRRFFRTNGNRVDLNRNFPSFWDEKAFWNRFVPSVFSPGAAPLSEPETRALDELASAERPDYVVSLHAFGEMIFIPFAGSREPPPDLALLRRLGAELAARMPRPYRVLRICERTRFFSARGAEIDHFYTRHGALSFLFEIGSGPSIGEPRGWFQPYAWYTPPPARLAADVANVLPALDWFAMAPPRGP